jgi:hypothetical protein
VLDTIGVPRSRRGEAAALGSQPYQQQTMGWNMTTDSMITETTMREFFQKVLDHVVSLQDQINYLSERITDLENDNDNLAHQLLKSEANVHKLITAAGPGHDCGFEAGAHYEKSVLGSQSFEQALPPLQSQRGRAGGHEHATDQTV